MLGTKTHANYNNDLWNAASYVTGSHDLTLVVHNGFSKRYKKYASYFCQYIVRKFYYFLFCKLLNKYLKNIL